MSKPTVLILGLLAVLLSGCVTRGYKLAPKSTPGPTLLDLSAALPPVEATLQNVIIFQGPGSWKREAYWDEYVLTVANRAATPAIIHSARLYGIQSDPVTPGDDPWALDKVSKKWWQTNAARQTGTYLALGAGTAVGAGVAYAAAVSELYGVSWGASVSAGTTTAGAIGTVTMVALPILAVGTVVANVHGKHKVEAEFTRRRLALPLSLAPGESVHGSLFFPITPGPQRLVLQCQADGETRPLIIDLAPLAGLHFRPIPPAATTLSYAGPK